jgi:hypothetical protein
MAGGRKWAESLRPDCDHGGVYDTATRITWEEIPPSVRGVAEGRLGSKVVRASNRRGGYSPSLAASCLLADGRSVFVKAVSSDQNPVAPEFLRREARVVASLPSSAPAPRLLDVIDDGHWIVMVFEHATGSLPAMPWQPDQLQLVLDATWALADVPAPPSLPSIEDRYATMLNGWRNLAADTALDGALDEWSARHLDRLAELEPSWVEAFTGNDLVHGDVRSDNVLLDGPKVTFVDWPAACRGRVLFDIVAMLPSIALEGGGDPEAVLAANGRAGVDPDAVTTLAVAMAGFFVDQARRPDPPGLPTVRAFQRAQADVCIAWLQSRLGW